jgi:hypothetical protein
MWPSWTTEKHLRATLAHDTGRKVPRQSRTLTTKDWVHFQVSHIEFLVKKRGITRKFWFHLQLFHQYSMFILLPSGLWPIGAFDSTNVDNWPLAEGPVFEFSACRGIFPSAAGPDRLRIYLFALSFLTKILMHLSYSCTCHIPRLSYTSLFDHTNNYYLIPVRAICPACPTHQ